ncbi:peptidylprolyl isomerase [Candidatus Wolfebacteria bacterium]|nr:peptidylprolyl isomerase [Candidatus Wolfebacteria bacterium]
MKNIILTIILIAAVGAAILYFNFNKNENNQKIQENQSEQKKQNRTDQTQMPIMTIKTNLGDIKIELFEKDVPKTVANFIKLSKEGFYDGTRFHRVIKGFMVQAGDPNSKDDDWSNDGMGGPGYQFEDELNPQKESYKLGYLKGIVAMANSGPNTNGSQFFIMLENYPLPRNYTIFGKVAEGQDIVDKIGDLKTYANDNPRGQATIEKIIGE